MKPSPSQGGYQLTKRRMADTKDTNREEAPPTPEHMTSEERMCRSDYAQVLFHNITESYPTGSDIECHYTITSLLEPMARDWIGIYKVGWSSVRDYVCFAWSPMSPSYQKGKDAKSCVTFEGSSMPREDGEFYQFCYVTSNGLVRGASTPFQLRQPGMDDYVEVEDMEDDIMVVKTRTSALEDDLKTVLLAKEKLIERSRMLEDERDSLLGKLVEFDHKMGSVKQERDMLAKIVEDCKGKLDGVRASNKELEKKHSDILEQLEQLTSERDTVAQKLADKESEMRLLQDRVHTLMKDNDMLAGTKKSLTEQKELFENHFTTSENRLIAYQRERDDMKKQISMLEEMCTSQREDVIRFKTDGEKMRSTLDRQNSTGRSDLAKIDSLAEQLRNAEDKLAAAEHCKQLVNDEMVALDQARQKASSDLEESRLEVHKFRDQLTKIEEQQKRENELISDEVAKCQVMLKNESREKERLAELLQQSNEQMREFVIGRLPEKEAALQILQDAQKDLKKQFSRLKKKASDMQKKLEKMQQEKREWRQRESELMQEVGDLKERLLMGQDEYKTQFVECARMKRELNRMQKSAATQGTSSLGNKKPLLPKCEKEVQVTSNDSTETQVDDNCSQTDAESIKMADLSSPEIQAQLDELGRELDLRNEKKNRYKSLFYEEREKNALLQRHYFEQLQKRDEEVNRMIEEEKLQAQSDRSNLNEAICMLKLNLDQRDRDIAKLKTEANERAPRTDEKRPQLHPGKAMAGASTCNYPEEMDPLRNKQDLTPPMTPLPPPISPVLLPTAKLAAVKAVVPDQAAVTSSARLVEEFFDEPETGNADTPNNSDPTDTENDIGASLSEKICPICNGIMEDLTEQEMMDHVNTHYTQECPMCGKVFPQDYDAFRQHVEEHF
ncbi:hypothetical protein LSAT2_022521 [Lamellibrachia satsuma]|nr:hypothetical protein LSAT2_022521 [Lamellibrachia satsuma]